LKGPILIQPVCENIRSAYDVTGSPSSPKKSSGGAQPEAYHVSLNSNDGNTASTGSAAVYRSAGKAPITALRQLVVNLLTRQGVTFDEAFSGETSVEIDDAARSEARALIAEDGFWGVEQTADRIVEFAVSAAGNDPAGLEAVRAAVSKGFNMAREALGGMLPDICQKTYEAAMSKLDAWASGTAPESININ